MCEMVKEKGMGERENKKVDGQAVLEPHTSYPNYKQTTSSQKGY